MTGFLFTMQAALVSFTRLPVAGKNVQAAHFERAIAFLPAAGLATGIIAAACYWLVQLFFPPGIAIFTALLAGILATGALHEDGFADCCDGFGAGTDPQSIQRIMKDPAAGSYAAIGLIALLAGKYLFLAHTLPEKHLAILPAMHLLARLVPLFIVASTPACNSHTAKMSANLQLSGRQLFGATVFTLAVSLVLLPAYLLLLATVAMIVLSLACRSFFIRRLGGYNGDCLGAGEQLGECLVLLFCAAYF